MKIIKKVTVWLTIINLRFGTLSASAPPSSEITVMGRAKAIVTNVKARGESFVSLKINHALVSCCIPIAIKEAKLPRSSHLQSMYLRELNAVVLCIILFIML